MDFTLSPELEDYRRRCQAFLEEELLPREDELEEHDDLNPPDEFYALRRKAVERGLGAPGFPTDVGGLGLGTLGEVVAFSTLAQAGLALAMVPPFPSTILMACTGEQREKYLLPCVRGEKQDAFAITEYEAGSDAAAIQTSAVRRDGGWVINGVKRFAGNGDRADFAIVFAVTDPDAERDRVTAFLVDKDIPGFRVVKRHKMMGLRGWHVAELAFEDCVVGEGQILGELGKGFEVARDWLSNGRIITGAGCIAQAERLVRLAKSHATTRVQFGQPIADFQAIQFMLADSATDLALARMLTFSAAWDADNGAHWRTVHTKAAMTKVFATEALARIADRTVQIFGASGFLEGIPERFYRNARIERIWDGTSEIQRTIVARSLIKHDLLV